MEYATYDYYQCTYRGNAIAEADFKRLALRAKERIDAMTYGRAEAYYARSPTPIANATCALAEAIQQTEQETGDGLPVHQERMDKYTVTYGARTASEQRKREAAAAGQYLLPTGLLYAGVPTKGW